MATRKPDLSLTRKDFEVTFYKGSGGGGQKRNKTMSGVRIKHIASGILATDCSTPSQATNKGRAFTRLSEDRRFRAWLSQAVTDKLDPGKDERERELAIRRRVDNSMSEKNLKVEYYSED